MANKVGAGISGSRERSPSAGSSPIGFDPGRKVADILTEARALVLRGWNRHDFTSSGIGIRHEVVGGAADGTCLCAVGAIAVVCGEMPYGEPAPTLEAASRLLGEAAGIEDVTPDGVGRWNTEQDSEKSVLAAFDKAIELARLSA